ncbi:MAG: hypothetical protein JWR21_3120 [Herminiimonas sp.]|nr:hypothetical protein [Herminiimonas sp.]
MAEAFFTLSRSDQREVLEQARAKTGRPTHLLEKDVWVVWTLGALFDSSLNADLTFKGGTSLSKAYKVIDRFSEDIDLTYDIRRLIADFIDGHEPLPANRSQANKWTKAVRERLPDWIATDVRPVVEAALARQNLDARLEIGGVEHDKLLLHYPALKNGTGYVSPVVVLEFGGRATGEPHQVLPITCDMDGHVPNISFPTAAPQVMSVTRTFWEKATAAHVYCAQGRIRSERYARHWHDLAALGRSRYLTGAISDRAVAASVAQHKSLFFVEKDSAGTVIDYSAAASGHLKIVPAGEARAALADDYAKMRADEVMLGEALDFDQLMHACGELQSMANKAAKA